MKAICISAMLVIGIVAAVSFVVLGMPGIASDPYTISAETTRIVTPLREDGSVDFVAALDQPLSVGVTSENNAAVLLWQAIGPPALDNQDSQNRVVKRLFSALQIPPLPSQGNYFLPLDDYANQLSDGRPPAADEDGTADVETADQKELDARLRTEKDPRLDWGGLMSAWPAGEIWGSNWRSALRTQFQQARMRPWTPEEFPQLAAWLLTNESPLQLAAEASQRPRYYSPLISTGQPASLDTLLTRETQIQELALTLAARAMLRLGDGQSDQAWQDVLAIHRLARLLAEGPWVDNLQTGFALDRAACSAGVAISLHGDLSASQLLSSRSDLRSLAPFSEAEKKLDNMRYPLIDLACAAARGDTRSRDTLLGEQLSSNLGSARCDWDDVLRNINGFYDLLVEAGQSSSSRQRNDLLAELDLLLQRARSFADEAEPTPQDLWAVVVARAEPIDVGSLGITRVEALSLLHLTDIALTLAAHHVEQGSYPAQLSDLGTAEADELPGDPWRNQQLIYHSNGSAFGLYSVGRDHSDEGGAFDRDIAVWSPYPDGESIPALIWRLKCRAPEICYPAATTLARMGAEAVPALEEAVEDKNAYLSAGANFVLNAIQLNR